MSEPAEPRSSAPARGSTLYRIVLTNPPSLFDFTSALGRGVTLLEADPEAMRLSSGISVYRTLGQAQRKAHDYPRLGSFVAELRIPPDAPIRIERTLPRSRGHHTLWGDPAVLLRCVVAIVPVG